MARSHLASGPSQGAGQPHLQENSSEQYEFLWPSEIVTLCVYPLPQLFLVTSNVTYHGASTAKQVRDRHKE